MEADREEENRKKSYVSPQKQKSAQNLPVMPVKIIGQERHINKYTIKKGEELQLK